MVYSITAYEAKQKAKSVNSSQEEFLSLRAKNIVGYYLRDCLREIRKASREGIYGIYYQGSSWPIFYYRGRVYLNTLENWNFKVIELLVTELKALGFRCWQPDDYDLSVMYTAYRTIEPKPNWAHTMYATTVDTIEKANSTLDVKAELDLEYFYNQILSRSNSEAERGSFYVSYDKVSVPWFGGLFHTWNSTVANKLKEKFTLLGFTCDVIGTCLQVSWNKPSS